MIQIPPPINKVGIGCLHNSSVDLIRVLAMLMVCVLHVARFSGWTELSNETHFVGKMISNAWEVLCVIAVNLYAMLTGYLCVTKRWNLQRYLELYIVVLFYALGCYLIAQDEKILNGTILFLIFNPFASFYWYFAAYSGLFVVMPFLNKGLREMPERKLITLLMVVLIAYSVLGCWRARYLAQDGHTAIWLMIMYAVGGYLKLYGCRVKTWKLVFAFALCSIVNFLVLCLQGKLESIMFRSYCSVSVVGASIAFFVIALRINIGAAWLKILLRWMSPMAFSVYLIHCHEVVLRLIGKYVTRLAVQSDYSWWFIPLFALLIYVACTLIDWIRIQIFSLLRIQEIVKWLIRVLPNRVKELSS